MGLMVEALVRASAQALYNASHRGCHIAMAFWISVTAGGAAAVYFIFVFLVNTNVEQQRMLILTFFTNLLQRLILRPSWEAFTTIWIIRSRPCESEDMEEKAAMSDERNVKMSDGEATDVTAVGLAAARGGRRDKDHPEYQTKVGLRLSRKLSFIHQCNLNFRKASICFK